MKNREELAKYFGSLGFRVGAEIGVFDGHYSEVLCKNIPNLKFYAIDPWQVYNGYRDHKIHKNMEKAYNLAQERLSKFNCKMIREFSMEAVKDFKDNSLDFVYIDGNHEFKYVWEDIVEWTKKVRVGGIVAGHDYYHARSGNTGVIDAADKYTKDNGYKLELTDWDDKNKIEDDRQPSFYFFK